MMLDPYDLARPPVLEGEDEQAEEGPRDYHDFFWDDVRLGHRYADDHWGIHTQVCRFDSEGNHVEMAKDCPHFNAVDEEGPRTRPGWTVQGRNNA